MIEETTNKEPKPNKSKQNKLPLAMKFLLGTMALAIGAILLTVVMREFGIFASGNDIWGHLFKSDLMYQNLMEGNPYPLYTKYWYNGIQPFRYWAPLPYYILAGLQWIAGGSIEGAYFLFGGLSFFIGGFGWLLWGISTNRIGLSTCIGMLWFFLPENIRVYYCEGNLPRMVTAILIPYLVYFVYLFVIRNRRIAVLPIILLTALMSISHLMISAMVGITTFIFMAFYMVSTKKILRPMEAIISMLFGYVIMGIWIYPALRGGLVGMDPEASLSVMKSLTYELTRTLDPINRLTGIVDTFYYGLSVIIICIVGLFLAKKEKKSGYYTNILILLCTTPYFIPILSKLPVSQLFWMMRFATIAYAFFLWSFLEWTTAKRYFTILLMSILIIDCIPSFNISRYYTQSAGRTNDEIAIAKNISNQRVAILDLSAYGSFPSWELAQGENATQYTYGWAWQGAATSSNIVMLNTALEEGYYEYLFDRCIEMGNDTVIVRKELLEKADKTKDDMLSAAIKSNYSLYKETNQTYIFYREMPDNFGVQTEYKGIAIGKFAGLIELPFPAFTVGLSDNIEDYSIEELLQYETIYLSGFEYYDRKKAEELTVKLAEQGTRIIIDMTHIPVDLNNNRMHFLDVYTQDIKFKDMLPTLIYKGDNLYGKRFPDDYRNWNTQYIEGVSNVIGIAHYSGKELTFAGSNDNKNIIFTGFNLLFYGMEAEDQEILKMISDYLGIQLVQLPQRTIVPIEIHYEREKIMIDAPISNVNTTIAYQDNFLSKDNIENFNNLLVVNQTHTEIVLIYPYLKEGITVSLVGVIGVVMWMIVVYVIDVKKERNKSE